MTGQFTNGDRRANSGGNVLIIDDCAVYRDALASALAANGVRPVRTAWDLPSLIGTLGALAPLVILLNLATIGVPTFLRATTSLSPRVPVIAIGASEDDEDALIACAEAGVAAYHMRADSLADLLVLIRGVAQGEISCPPEVSAILLRRASTVAGRRRPVARDPGLTSREIQILRLLRLGRSNQDIASHLSIAVHTVKSHVHSLLTKLGVSTRAEAAAMSHDLDLDPGPHDGSGSGSSRNWSR
ncbi:response regulator transcription factor [Mycobacterium sp. NAZ190054]|uniref:LuxR C-terminal-related transcriptional regulator n=1 Tax=Mycobacterium sp. NAZ190054 TaxID=1747766 RepID=UPI0009EB3E12|nr:response regulator transcription factor [Mycobacterium sp. NAZ190054]